MSVIFEKIIKNSIYYIINTINYKNNKLISKWQQRFKSEKHNVFIEEVNKIALIANNHKRIQSIDSTETYAYETKK